MRRKLDVDLLAGCVATKTDRGLVDAGEGCDEGRYGLKGPRSTKTTPGRDEGERGLSWDERR